jgi:hypothetical protein
MSDKKRALDDAVESPSSKKLKRSAILVLSSRDEWLIMLF